MKCSSAVTNSVFFTLLGWYLTETWAALQPLQAIKCSCALTTQIRNIFQHPWTGNRVGTPVFDDLLMHSNPLKGSIHSLHNISGALFLLPQTGHQPTLRIYILMMEAAYTSDTTATRSNHTWAELTPTARNCKSLTLITCIKFYYFWLAKLS